MPSFIPRVTGLALLAALTLAGCSSSTPIVASERASTGALLESLRGAGLCEGDVNFSPPILQVLDEVSGYCQQDELVITFFPPSGNGSLTVVFPPFKCSVDVDDEPMVWGMNWTIIARPDAAADALDRVASATNAKLTSTRTALGTFCDAFLAG
jgi:hypothetical protein